MPRVSAYYGIVVSMYYNDHAPPHFHVKYAEHKASIVIETLEYWEGKLPRRVYNLAVEWAALHREELQRNWDLARQGLPLLPIEPLE